MQNGTLCINVCERVSVAYVISLSLFCLMMYKSIHVDVCVHVCVCTRVHACARCNTSCMINYFFWEVRKVVYELTDAE